MNDTLCNQTTYCLQGFVSSDGLACHYYPMPNTVTGCSDPCYDVGPTQCNGRGQCIGADDTACVGVCTASSDCPDIFNWDFQFNADPVNFWQAAGWYNPYGCNHGACVYMLIDIFAASSPRPIFKGSTTYEWTPVGSRHPCIDYFLPDAQSMYKSCFRTERYLLDVSMVPSYTEFSSSSYGNATFPFQLSVCLGYFDCAVAHPESGDLTISTISKRAAAQDAVHPSTLGFYSTSTEETPRGNRPMGLTSAAARNAFWVELRDTVAPMLEKQVLPDLALLAAARRDDEEEEKV
jgi:hypothetical protein